MVVSNIFGIFTPKIGEDSHFDEHIFRWVGSTTNQTAVLIFGLHHVAGRSHVAEPSDFGAGSLKPAAQKKRKAQLPAHCPSSQDGEVTSFQGWKPTLEVGRFVVFHLKLFFFVFLIYNQGFVIKDR